MKMLLYCTKAKPYLLNQNIYEFYESKYITSTHKFHEKQDYLLNGKIVAECDFEVEDLKPCMSPIDKRPYAYMTRTLERWELTENSCLSFEQLDDYLKGKKGYAIHIKNLKIFDEPRELDFYMTYDKSYDNMFGWAFEEAEKYKPLTKAPQNMMYVERDDIRYVYIKYVLISIQPQWLCKILNGEKTIEVRKKVLKGMIK